MLEDEGFLSQQFRRSLLKSQTAFHAGVNIPELPPLNVRWTGIGQTAGVALWERDGRIGAASIFLNGVELDEEVTGIEAFFSSHRLPMPKNLWGQIAKHPRPLLITAHYDLSSFTDPVCGLPLIASASASYRAKTSCHGSPVSAAMTLKNRWFFSAAKSLSTPLKTLKTPEAF